MFVVLMVFFMVFIAPMMIIIIMVFMVMIFMIFMGLMVALMMFIVLMVFFMVFISFMVNMFLLVSNNFGVSVDRHFGVGAMSVKHLNTLLNVLSVDHSLANSFRNFGGIFVFLWMTLFFFFVFAMRP